MFQSVWYFLFLVQFNSIQAGLSFAALLCWIAKQGKKCGAKIWFNNQPFNPLTLPSRNLAYHLSTFCSVRTELMWTPSSLWLVMNPSFWIEASIKTHCFKSYLITNLIIIITSSLAARSQNAEKYLIEARMFNRGLFTGNESLFWITGSCQHSRG